MGARPRGVIRLLGLLLVEAALDNGREYVVVGVMPLSVWPPENLPHPGATDESRQVEGGRLLWDGRSNTQGTGEDLNLGGGSTSSVRFRPS